MTGDETFKDSNPFCTYEILDEDYDPKEQSSLLDKLIKEYNLENVYAKTKCES